VSEDGRAATVVVPLPRQADSTALADAVRRVRASARAGLPSGVTAQVTGPAGITADLAGVFDGPTSLCSSRRSPWWPCC
jgi:putative drug exporter of the RND superfamily